VPPPENCLIAYTVHGDRPQLWHHVLPSKDVIACLGRDYNRLSEGCKSSRPGEVYALCASRIGVAGLGRLKLAPHPTRSHKVCPTFADVEQW